MTIRAIELANSVWLALVSRLLSIVVAPVLIWFGSTMLELKDATTNLNAVVVIALEPRVKVLEEDFRDLRNDVQEKTASRFTKEDAAIFKADMLRNIERLEKQLEILRKAVK